ncbi:MAG: hypothetical protein SF339_22875 [Blastocatellia bacterium]|nr:hypothetical protein [Blastocatellia bacterium]
MMKWMLYLFIAVILSVLLAVSFYFSKRRDVLSDNSSLGFPFRIMSETHLPGTPPARSVVIILDPQYYSKPNLDRLFRWYSMRNPDNSERIEAVVYTDLKNIPSNVDDWMVADRPIGEREKQASLPRGRLIPFDAFFWRQGSGALAGGGRNEWYIYLPDLGNSRIIKRVVLRGRDPFADKRVIDEWQKANGSLKIMFTVYELPTVEPSGIYYTCTSVSGEIRNYEEIFTLRQDRIVTDLAKHVCFINESIAYIFMGWIYSVTVDGGKTWVTWDAEKNMYGWQCCDSTLIQDVTISANGSGKMTLNQAIIPAGAPLVLWTNDYGKHWREK